MKLLTLDVIWEYNENIIYECLSNYSVNREENNLCIIKKLTSKDAILPCS